MFQDSITYSYDDSCRTRVVDGFEEAGYTDVEGAVNAALELLTVCHSKKDIAKVIRDQDLRLRRHPHRNPRIISRRWTIDPIIHTVDHSPGSANI